MGNQFDWQFEEDPDHQQGKQNTRRWMNGVVLFWILAIILTLSILGFWFGAREKGETETQDLVQVVQSIVDIQQRAIIEKDGELFFSLQDNDPNWFVSQLLPQNQAIYRSGLAITNAEAKAEKVWANAVWQEEGESYQRILFFEWRAGQLRQIATDPDYWGTTLQSESNWGNLAYYAVDDTFAATIEQFITEVINEACTRACLLERLPLTIEMRDDFAPTAEPNRLHIPSPHLLGLDETGRPSSLFWQVLSSQLNLYLTPATIRFAVPPARIRDGQTNLPYDTLARKFMETNPHIQIELVHLGEIPQDLSSLAHDYDGAAVVPTEAMLAAGEVHDLSDFITSDADFDKSDFYEQIWQGNVWQERTWFMPIAAEMQVMYYDKAAYREAGFSEPSSRWTWQEMAKDVSSIVAGQPQPGELSWGFLDVGLDSLFSYAYNWNNQCAETATILCRTPLSSENVASALGWYHQMASQPDQMPDLTKHVQDFFSRNQMPAMGGALDDNQQAMVLLNFQGSDRRAAIWVDSPVNYEFNLLLSPVGVVPFPGSDRFDGITPLWLHGGFISQFSEQPLAVWQWLKFLSYQSPMPRLIPARPSVAAQSGYWVNLPQPLEDAMRTAFPFARPVTIEEMSYLNWAQVVAVLSGEATPEQAAMNRLQVQWFLTPE